MLAEGKSSGMRFGIFTNRRVNWKTTTRVKMKLKVNDLSLWQTLLYSPMEEVVPSSISVDCGESLKTAGDVRGEWWLADVLQALQLANQNPGNRKRSSFTTSYCTVLKWLNSDVNVKGKMLITFGHLAVFLLSITHRWHFVQSVTKQFHLTVFKYPFLFRGTYKLTPEMHYNKSSFWSVTLSGCENPQNWKASTQVCLI